MNNLNIPVNQNSNNLYYNVQDAVDPINPARENVPRPPENSSYFTKLSSALGRASSKVGDIGGEALSNASEFANTNPIIGGVANAGLAYFGGRLIGAGAKQAAVWAAPSLARGAVDQVQASRQQSLYNPSINAMYAGANDGQGYNTNSILEARLRRLYAETPTMYRPQVEKYIKGLGIKF